MLWNCVIKTRTENYMFHYPKLEWEWIGLCTKKSVTERPFKITKNKPRLSSDDISTNILHCLEWKIICIIYNKCMNSQINKTQLPFPHSKFRQADLVWCNWLTTEGRRRNTSQYNYNWPECQAETESQLLLSENSEPEVRSKMLPREQKKKQN